MLYIRNEILFLKVIRSKFLFLMWILDMEIGMMLEIGY